MKINESGLELIKDFEGLRTKAYRCPSGVWTIGYGHTCGVREGDYCTEDQAEEMLNRDIRLAEQALDTAISQRLTNNQYSALVAFTFNVGSGWLQKSGLVDAIHRERYDDVPAQLMRWVKGTLAGRRVPMSGLKRRREAECELWGKPDD